jgi:hypothetical protein
MIQQHKTLRAFGLCLAIAALLFITASKSYARTEVQNDGTTKAEAEQEAEKYFRPKSARHPAAEEKPDQVSDQKVQQASSTTPPDTDAVGPQDHYLALHLGGFLSSDAYQWSGADPHSTNPGRLNAGLTYKMGPLGRLADWAWRADLAGYEFSDGRALQVSVLPMLMFPEADSRFPLYFGMGLGLGILPTQLQSKSFLALDYQLIGGVRFFNVLGNAGFFAETGLKNSVFLLSDGQFNGWSLAVGTLFTF